MPNKPLVSVCVPVFNSKKTVLNSINSILNQSYRNIEVIISDNNSDDGTFEICKKLKKKDKRIRLFKQKKNLGLDNFKFVFLRSKGKFIMWHPSHWFRSKNYIKDNLMSFKDKNIIASFSKELFFDEYKNKKDWINFNLDKTIYENLKVLIFYFNRCHGVFYALYRKDDYTPLNEIKSYIAFDWNFAIARILNGKIKRIKKSYTLIGRGASTKQDFFKKNRNYKIEFIFPYYSFFKKFVKQIIYEKKLDRSEKFKTIILCVFYLFSRTLQYYKKELKRLLF
tara:strand:- start:4078 stop:4920 length:843 start_codon:yes stop_codon:yes gene_type:complete